MTQSTYDLDEAMNRMVAMEAECLGLAENVKAAPYWPFTHTVFPYWWNRITNMEIDITLAAEFDIDIYTVQAGLVIGHIGSGYEGDRATDAYDYIPTVLAYFDNHAEMTDTVTYTTPFTGLWLEGGYGLALTGIPGGFAATNNSGSGPMQHVLHFEFTMPLMRQKF